MKQKIKNVIHTIKQAETRRKICRFMVKSAAYITLAAVGIAALFGLIFAYCLLRTII